jgi:ferric-dicitrate binding protein FerR (iron transport regulator)
MSDDLDWRLLDRHLAGEASPDDQLALRRWLAAEPTRETSLRALTSVVRTPDGADWDTRRAWSRFSPRLDEPRLSLYLDRRPSTSKRERVWYAAAVGALATGVLMAIAWWFAAFAEVH